MRTMETGFMRFFFLAFFATTCLVFSGCVVSGPVVATDHTVCAPGQEGGPPPWAPAHGYRAKYRYYYYPDMAVYFDVSRGLYFYLQNGRWVTAASLPQSVAMALGNYVVLEMDTERPYEFHKDVVKRSPPGHAKKKK